MGRYLILFLIKACCKYPKEANQLFDLVVKKNKFNHLKKVLHSSESFYVFDPKGTIKKQ